MPDKMLFLLGMALCALTPQEETQLKELAALYAQIDNLSQKAPLNINKITLLTAPAEGRGIYQELRGPAHSEELYLYAQLQNHTIREVEPERYEIHLSSDIAIYDEDGTLLVQDRGFGRSHFFAKTKHRETYVNIAIRAHGIPDGRYTLKLTVTDILSGKKANASVPFAVQLDRGPNV